MLSYGNGDEHGVAAAAVSVDGGGYAAVGRAGQHLLAPRLLQGHGQVSTRQNYDSSSVLGRGG